MKILSKIWNRIQDTLFPRLEDILGPLSEMQKKLIAVLELVRVEDFVDNRLSWTGRPKKDRIALARAFIVKAMYNLQTTRALIDRLTDSPNLRRICGWEKRSEIPHESAFSRAFAEFSTGELPQRVHAVLIEKTLGDRLAGHISRDSTAIEAREKPVPKPKPEKREEPKRKCGRPRKGEKRTPKEPTRLERQRDMTMSEMIDNLPIDCNCGTKRDSNGNKFTWKGYKMHVDCADGAIPVSCILTSASLHDSQAALPLALISAERVTNFYDLMDSAYDAIIIREQSIALNHVPIIARNPRRSGKIEMDPAEKARYRERNAVERLFGRLKDEFGGRNVRVRGHSKVMAHLMFGILALTADQLLRLVA